MDNKTKPLDEKLIREIGVGGLAAGFINFIVGAGIYVLPASVAILLGPSSLLAYLICGALMILIMLCFAETGSKFEVSGGPYTYIQAAFGPYFGFLSNILFWFGYAVLADAAIANAMLDMIALQFEFLTLPIYRGLFFFLLFGTFGSINVMGVKYGINVVKTLTLIKLVPLVLLVFIGVFWIEVDHYTIDGWPSSVSLGEASLLLFFAFGGGEGALSAGGEIKNPRKTVPAGIFIGISGVVILYLCIHLVCQGILGGELVQYHDAPLAEVASRIAGSPGKSLLLIAAVVSIFSTLSGSPMFYPRVIYAGALQGWGPPSFRKVHPKFATPYMAILLYATLQFTLAISGGFRQLAIISSAALLLLYLGVVLATIKFKLKKDSEGEKGLETGFTLPFGMAIPVLSSIVILWFLTQLTRADLISVLIFFGALSVIYVLIKMTKRQ